MLDAHLDSAGDLEELVLDYTHLVMIPQAPPECAPPKWRRFLKWVFGRKKTKGWRNGC
jgi:hypothetical protein